MDPSPNELHAQFKKSRSGFSPIILVTLLSFLLVGLIFFFPKINRLIKENSDNVKSGATSCSTYTTSTTCSAVSGCSWKTASTEGVLCSSRAQAACGTDGLCEWRGVANCNMNECLPSEINGCKYTSEQTASCSNFTNQGTCAPTGCTWSGDTCGFVNNVCPTGCTYTSAQYETRYCSALGTSNCKTRSECTLNSGSCKGRTGCSAFTSLTSCSNNGCSWSAASCTGTYSVLLSNATCTGEINKSCKGTYVSVPSKCQKSPTCLVTPGVCSGTPTTTPPTEPPATPPETCTYPGQTCNKPNLTFSCKTSDNRQGTQKCTATLCGSSDASACYLSPKNCTSCVANPLPEICNSPSAACYKPNQTYACKTSDNRPGTQTCTLTRCTSSSPFSCDLSPKDCSVCLPINPPETCATPSSACFKPNQIVACTTNDNRVGTKICTMTQCSSSTPAICSLSPKYCSACIATAGVTTPPPESAICSAPGSACNLTQTVSCTAPVSGALGSRTCTFTVCGSGNVCSQGMKNCTTCIPFEPKLEDCRENCLAAGNTASQCALYPSCNIISRTCADKDDYVRCYSSYSSESENVRGYCKNKTCVALVGENAACVSGNQCNQGLVCIDNKCRKVSLMNGATCVQGIQCRSKLCLGGKCVGVNLTNGSRCTSDIQCRSAFCNKNNSGGRCEAKNKPVSITSLPGGSCGTKPATAYTESMVFDCPAGYSCDGNSLCRKQLLAGSPCTNWADCKSGRCDRITRTVSRCVGNNWTSSIIVPGMGDIFQEGADTRQALYFAAIDACIADKPDWTPAQCRGYYASLSSEVGTFYDMNSVSVNINDRDCAFAFKMNGDSRSVRDLYNVCKDIRNDATFYAGSTMLAAPIVLMVGTTVLPEVWLTSQALGGGGLITSLLSMPESIRLYIASNPSWTKSVNIVNNINTLSRFYGCFKEMYDRETPSCFEPPTSWQGTILRFLKYKL